MFLQLKEVLVWACSRYVVGYLAISKKIIWLTSRKHSYNTEVECMEVINEPCQATRDGCYVRSGWSLGLTATIPGERHGYPWVPTDQGLRGPCQVDPTCQKPRRPASGPRDLIHNPGNLGTPRTT
jgi:hypothetical protein